MGLLFSPVLAPSLPNATNLTGCVRALAFLGSLLLPLALSSCGGAVSDPAPQPPPPPPASVTVSAPSGSVATGQTAQFSVTVQNAQNPAVNWAVNMKVGGDITTVGSITPQGLYTAPANPPTPPTVTVSAALASDASKSGSAPIAVVPAGPPTFGILSWRNDPLLSGVNSQETALTPASITNNPPSRKFGKLFACTVDGEVYAEPLYAASVSIAGEGLHNVVFAATEHDSVYAFDADAAPCQTLWRKSFLDSVNGVTTVPACLEIGGSCADGGTSNDVGTNDITPEIGITGTPVIDPASQTLYVVAKTKESTVNGQIYVQRLHALDITTGQERPGGPTIIQASVNGNGDGSNGMGQVLFDPLPENQRAALALSGGNVYAAFGSNGNVDPFHGWLLAYSASTLAPVGVFNTTPNSNAGGADRGGISESGAAPSFDANGNIFVVTSEGTFDANNANPPNTEYAQTLLRLRPNLASPIFLVADRFTPFNEAALNADNQSLGSSGALLLPDQSTGPPHLAIIGGEAGVLYVVNRDTLGGFTLGGPDHVLQTMNLKGAIYGTPVFWQGKLYATATGQNLNAYALSGGTLGAPLGAPSTETFAFPAPSPVISANGASSGIVWVIDSSGYGANGAPATPAVLRAYDAANLGNEVYASSQNNADAAGLAVKYTVPTVAKGKVYVGTQGELSVYGLLP